jgi:PD-(D/E)XK nuclease superfamily
VSAGIALEHLSASSASTYGECARRWRELYGDGLPRVVTPPLVFGSAWDRTVERVLRGPERRGSVGLSRPALLARWLEAWSECAGEAEASGRMDWSGDLAADLENEGRLLCALPKTRDVLVDLRVRVERGELALQRRVSLSVPGVPVPVIGFVDVWLEDGTVVDVKTARRPWPATKPRTDLQPRVYLAALQQEGFPLSGLRFRHLVWVRGGRPQLQVLDTEFSQGELFVALDALRETWRGIAAGVFPPNFGCWRCGPACEVFRAGRCLGRR